MGLLISIVYYLRKSVKFELTLVWETEEEVLMMMMTMVVVDWNSDLPSRASQTSL